MKKLFVLLLLIGGLVMLNPAPAEAQTNTWCCRRIFYAKTSAPVVTNILQIFITALDELIGFSDADFYSGVFEVSTEDKCLDTCKNKNILVKNCQNYYRKDSHADKASNSCVGPSSGCCMITDSDTVIDDIFARPANSQTECNYYCEPLSDCESIFYPGMVPNNNKNDCVKDKNSASGQMTNITFGSGKLINPLNANGIPAVIKNVISKFLTIVGAIALLMFVYGGFRWLTSAGNEKSIEAGRDILLWATVGLLLTFLSYILVGFVLQAFGVM